MVPAIGFGGLGSEALPSRVRVAGVSARGLSAGFVGVSARGLVRLIGVSARAGYRVLFVGVTARGFIRYRAVRYRLVGQQ